MKNEMQVQEMQVQTDAELEKDSEHPIGSLVHLSTVTHAWRGTLVHVTPNYFVLEVGAVMVGNTGDIKAYAEKLSNGQDESEPITRRVRVPRAAVAWML